MIARDQTISAVDARDVGVKCKYACRFGAYMDMDQSRCPGD